MDFADLLLQNFSLEYKEIIFVLFRAKIIYIKYSFFPANLAHVELEMENKAKNVPQNVQLFSQKTTINYFFFK